MKTRLRLGNNINCLQKKYLDNFGYAILKVHYLMNGSSRHSFSFHLDVSLDSSLVRMKRVWSYPDLKVKLANLMAKRTLLVNEVTMKVTTI